MLPHDYVWMSDVLDNLSTAAATHTCLPSFIQTNGIPAVSRTRPTGCLVLRQRWDRLEVQNRRHVQVLGGHLAELEGAATFGEPFRCEDGKDTWSASSPLESQKGKLPATCSSPGGSGRKRVRSATWDNYDSSISVRYARSVYGLQGNSGYCVWCVCRVCYDRRAAFRGCRAIKTINRTDGDWIGPFIF